MSICPYCHGRGYLTEPSPYSYRPGDTVTRTCDCRPRDPETPILSKDDLLYPVRRDANAIAT